MGEESKVRVKQDKSTASPVILSCTRHCGLDPESTGRGTPLYRASLCDIVSTYESTTPTSAHYSGLATGTNYRISVRAVSKYGARGTPVTVYLGTAEVEGRHQAETSG